MIGDNLRRYRKNNKMTQKELADKVNVSTGYIQMLELGKKENPSMNLLSKIASVLRITVSDLMNSNEKKDISMDRSSEEKNDSELVEKKKRRIFSEIEKRYNLLNLVGGMEALKSIDTLRFKIEYRQDKGINTGLHHIESMDTDLKNISDLEMDLFK